MDVRVHGRNARHCPGRREGLPGRRRRIFGRGWLAGLVWGLLVSFPLTAQDTWTLEDCLAFSRKNNLTVQQQEYEKGKNQLRLLATRKKYLPVVDGRWRSASNWGFLIDPSTNILDRKFNFGNQFTVNANWDIFNGSASSHQTRVYSQELKAAEYHYEATVNQAALEVIYHYLQVLLSSEQVQVAHQRVRQLENQQHQFNRQVARGRLNKRDLLSVQSLLAAENLNLVLADNNLEKARFTLMQAIGLQQDSLIRLAPLVMTDSLLTAGLSAGPLLAGAEGDFPELKAQQARIEAARAGLAVVRSTKLPVLSLGAQLGSRTSSFQEIEFNRQLKENFNQQLGLNFSIPIFNNHLFQTNIGLAKLELESARTAYRQIQEELRQRILSATLDHKAAYRMFVSAQQRFEALKEEFRFAEKQLGLGLINPIVFGEVRSRYYAAQSELIQAKYDCLFKWKILRYYQGEPLS